MRSSPARCTSWSNRSARADAAEVLKIADSSALSIVGSRVPSSPRRRELGEQEVKLADKLKAGVPALNNTSHENVVRFADLKPGK